MNLKELRMQNSLTQAELGMRIGKKQVTISQYETGIRKPNLLTARKLADALDISLDTLLEAIDKKEEEE